MYKRQGYLIAEELVKNGASVSLISGPTNLSTPSNLSNFIKVETAEEMLKVCLKIIPKDLFISVAAVTDWKIDYNKHKMKKEEGIQSKAKIPISHGLVWVMIQV